MGQERSILTAKVGWHVKARLEKPPEYPDRFPVPDDRVAWAIELPGYRPPYYVSPVVLANDSTTNKAGWADPEDLARAPVPGESFSGILERDPSGRPLNPVGRTGMAGRGLLGRWGPNHAADPIVTRINRRSGEVELLAVQRRDNGQWAIPGGMVDKGEEVSRTLVRELREETGAALDMSKARAIYRGYVDDPRNTDHAWMETTANHLHLDPGTADRMDLRAGSDARAVRWLPLGPETVRRLYASHCALVKASLSDLIARPPADVPEEERTRVERLLRSL